MASDLDRIIEYETMLQDKNTRSNQKILEKLLSPDFREVEKSGLSFDFKLITTQMQSEKDSEWTVHSQNYQCITLSESVQLLLYQSAHRNQQGNYSDFCKRSSIWLFNKGRWQMPYHQGMPCETFSISENISAKQSANSL
ncbi:DUF4440 domain-containing protein [Microbulbifer sp. THAF38]|uniref:DUF4440 domain-containing protein n=1 Tax=Microbulbifer sp. THAF38 TaxID=2587856 RepID=UPI00126882AF|nr:DUF4440 domain-containing protein [Microbulbifer sp. THAF38]QFT54134.1 hypothetical protein FIU95_06125 [Microbulbifer sp. THAF38]